MSLICFAEAGAEVATGKDVQSRLIAMGLEDVAVADEPDALYVTFTDNVRRGPARGLFEVFSLLRQMEINKDIRLIPQEDRVPQAVVTLPEGLPISAAEVSLDVDEAYKKFRHAAAGNPSAGKIDIILYPQLMLNNAWYDKLYGAVVNIAPAVRVGLWKGASFTGQVIFPIWNNMDGEVDHIRAGMLVFRQELRLPKNIFLTLSAGNFNANRIGADLSMAYRTGNGLWETGINGGITGSSTFYGGKWEVTSWKRASGSAFLQYNEPGYNLQIRLAAHRYIYGDYGGRLDVTRHFGEVAIGLYAMYSGGEANGGFHFSVPLPGKKRMKPRAVRIGIPEYFDWEYEAQSGNEYAARKLGRYYETRPDENRNQRNYNPAYIKALLGRYAAHTPNPPEGGIREAAH